MSIKTALALAALADSRSASTHLRTLSNSGPGALATIAAITERYLRGLPLDHGLIETTILGLAGEDSDELKLARLLVLLDFDPAMALEMSLELVESGRRTSDRFLARAVAIRASTLLGMKHECNRHIDLVLGDRAKASNASDVDQLELFVAEDLALETLAGSDAECLTDAVIIDIVTNREHEELPIEDSTVVRWWCRFIGSWIVHVVQRGSNKPVITRRRAGPLARLLDDVDVRLPLAQYSLTASPTKPKPDQFWLVNSEFRRSYIDTLAPFLVPPGISVQDVIAVRPRGRLTRLAFAPLVASSQSVEGIVPSAMFEPRRRGSTPGAMPGADVVVVLGPHMQGVHLPPGSVILRQPDKATLLQFFNDRFADPSGVLVVHAHHSHRHESGYGDPSATPMPDEVAGAAILLGDRISIGDLIDLDLSGWGVCLVVCGAGAFAAAGEVEGGIVLDLLDAGAAWVLASPWLVADTRHSTAFIDEVVSRIVGTTRVPAAAPHIALRDAMQNSKSPHPIVWAPWRIFT